MKNTMIRKYEIQPFMSLPKGFRILSVQWLDKELMMWAAINPFEEEEIMIEIAQVGTGHFEYIDEYNFIGTYQFSFSSVFHLFWRQM